MNGILIRILIAVIVVVILFALIPPVLRVLGLVQTADLTFILKVVIGGLALLYIVRGSSDFKLGT